MLTSRTQIYFFVFSLLLANAVVGQTPIFNETFNELNGATSGTDLFGTGWNATCPTCEGYYEVRNGRFEQNNSGRTAVNNVLPEFITDPIDVSNCNTLTIRMNYEGDNYAGNGNFESEVECTSCSGLVSDYDTPGCKDCWDFFLVDLVYNNATTELVRFIGANNDLPPADLIQYPTNCLGNVTTAQLRVRTQTWESGETNSMDNILIICNDIITNTVDIDLDPPQPDPIFCEGEDVTLELLNAAGHTNAWFDPDGNTIIRNQPSISFLASANFGLNVPQTYTATTQDASGCKYEASFAIIVREEPDINLPADITLCQGEDYELREDGGDAISWQWSGPYPGNSNLQSWNLLDVNPSHSGLYLVEILGSNGCENVDFINMTVEPGGTLNLPDISTQCVNGSDFSLPTTIDGLSGTWAGPGVAGDVLSPSTLTSGTYELTFTPASGGCAMMQTTSVEVLDMPISFPTSTPLEVCGSGITPFDLTERNEEVNGGTGENVVWYEDAALTLEITDPTNYTGGTGTVYGVVEIGNCNSNGQELNLIRNMGPDITATNLVSVCGSYMLPNISVSDGVDPAYYELPMGGGSIIPVGTVFTTDTIIYAFDQGMNCFDEEMIDIRILQSGNAGPDRLVDTCLSEKLALISLLPSVVDPGVFYDENGVEILTDSLDVLSLGVNSLTLVYETFIIGTCPADQATFTINLQSAADAGSDSEATICTNQTIDINTLAQDNGAAGTFFFPDGTPVTELIVSLFPGDQPFTNEYLYVVSSGACTPDTAHLTLVGAQDRSVQISGEECYDYEIDVLGTIYNRNNPTGSESTISRVGCDSIIVIDLQFRPENRILLDNVLCLDQAITVNNVLYDEGNPTGTEVLVAADRFGCDSIVDIDLSFDTEIRTQLNIRLCQGSDTLINSVLYDENNLQGSSTLTSSSGCDSIVEVIATVGTPSMAIIDGVFCPNDTIVIGDQMFFISNPIGEVLIEGGNAEGCDSSVMVDMQFDLSTTINYAETLCSDENRVINGVLYDRNNPSGIEVKSNNTGCDSIFIVDLVFVLNDTVYIDGVFCNDTSFIINNTIYDRSNPIGTEVEIGQSLNGCDRYTVIDLQFVGNVDTTLNSTLCFGDSLVVNGNVYNEENTVGEEILISQFGCDSIVNIDLDFTGVEISLAISQPSCESISQGTLAIDIQSDQDEVEDVILDGVSILSSFETGVPFDIGSGDHELVVFSISGCSLIRNFQINEVDNETLMINVNLVDEEFYELTFDFSGDASQISWSPQIGLSCTDCETVQVRPERLTSYVLAVTDENGCVFTDEVELSFLAASVLYQANVFSPNDDGINDIFYIQSEGEFAFSNFRIFDRWGNQVFSMINGFTNNTSDGWDGFGFGSGVYVYYLEVDFPDGPQTISGEVSLIR